MPPLSPPPSPRQPELGEFNGRGISVIIPARTDTPLLRRAMWSVRTTADLAYEIVARPGPESVAQNRNACLDRAGQDLVAFVDDDVLLTPGWMSGLVAGLAADDGIGAVSALLSFADGQPQMSRFDLPAGELWRTTIPGTCFAYSRQRVGDLRFDADYRGSQWEDTDWMWSVQAAGLATVVTGDVRVVHEHRPRDRKELEHNMRHFHHKWGRLPEPGEVATISADELRRWHRTTLPGAP